MSGNTAAFIIWAVCGAAFIGFGIYCFFSKTSRTFGFWANVKMFEVKNVRGYNRALGKLWCVYGMIFIALGLPLNAGQNSPYVIFSILGTMFVTVAVMAIYVIKIEKKYRKE